MCRCDLLFIFDPSFSAALSKMSYVRLSTQLSEGGTGRGEKAQQRMKIRECIKKIVESDSDRQRIITKGDHSQKFLMPH